MKKIETLILLIKKNCKKRSSSTLNYYIYTKRYTLLQKC